MSNIEPATKACPDCNKQYPLIENYGNRCFDCAVAYILNRVKTIETAKSNKKNGKAD